MISQVALLLLSQHAIPQSLPTGVIMARCQELGQPVTEAMFHGLDVTGSTPHWPWPEPLEVNEMDKRHEKYEQRTD